jgi:arylsulfatase A
MAFNAASSRLPSFLTKGFVMHPLGIRILFLTATFCCLSSSMNPFADSSETPMSLRPNILLILCDDLGYGDLHCYGHPHIKTPHLDALAQTGIRLTSCYSAAPVCSPSRVGLMTGRSPNRAGVYDWIPEVVGSEQPRHLESQDLRDSVHMRAEEITLPRLLCDAGYATCMAGKWHCNSRFNSTNQPQPSDAGFDHWFATQNNAAPSHINPTNFVRNGQPVGQQTGTSCQIVANEVIDWLENHQRASVQQPFFAYVAFHEPHEPVASPPELVSEYLSKASNENEAQYFANVTNLDAAVGRLVASLDELNCRDNTLIVFSADNGPETLRRYRKGGRSYGRPGPLRGMKLWTNDAGFRVAGIINWPLKKFVHHESDEVVSSLDFLPTFCELADAPIPADLALDGCSIVPLLEGKTISRKRPLLWCYYNSTNEHRVAMRSGPWKMLAKLDHGKLHKVSNVFGGNHDVIKAAELTDFELYRISDDVHEDNNLYPVAKESFELQKQMQAHYSELMRDSHVWTR